MSADRRYRVEVLTVLTYRTVVWVDAANKRDARAQAVDKAAVNPTCAPVVDAQIKTDIQEIG